VTVFACAWYYFGTEALILSFHRIGIFSAGILRAIIKVWFSVDLKGIVLKTQFWYVIVIFFLVVEVLLLLGFIARGFMATSFYRRRRFCPAATSLDKTGRVEVPIWLFHSNSTQYSLFSVFALYWSYIFGSGTVYFASLFCCVSSLPPDRHPFFVRRCPCHLAALAISRCFWREYIDDKQNAVRKKYTRFSLDKKIFTAPESERVGQK